MDSMRGEPVRDAASSVQRELDIRVVACGGCACQLYRTIIAVRDTVRKNRGRLCLIMAARLGFVV